MERGPEPQQVFVGWSRALLDAARDHILSLDADLGGVVVVVPGSRAARGLLVRLVDAAKGGLVPPRIVTPGEAMGQLWPVEGRIAAGIECRAAWIGALRGVGAGVLGALTPDAPSALDVRGWSGLAALLERCSRELGAELLRFEDVPRLMGAGFPEQDRWHALARVQVEYERVLRGWGMVDADLARIAGGARGAAVDRVVIAGVADMPRAMREAVRRMGEWAMVLVFAPESMADRFDDVGCVIPERWAGAKLGLSDSAIVFADGPGDQADRALEAIAEHAGLRSDEVIVGVPDAEVVPAMRRRAERCAGVKVRYAGGTPVSRTAPWRLLAAIAELLEQRTVASLASLVRHPDVERWLVYHMPDRNGREREWWLDEVDQYLTTHLHGAITGAWASERPARARLLAQLTESAVQLLAGLDPPRSGAPAARRPAAGWSGEIIDVLVRVYGGRALVRADAADRAVIEALGAIQSATRELSAIGAVEATCAEALRLALERAGASAVPEEADADAIELLGWLELPADPAPVAVVTGLNEGRIPASNRGDPLLPESVRDALGVGSAAARLARDAYVLAAVAGSRAHVTLIAGRRSADGEPLWPSRLLLMEEPGTVGARVRRFAGRDEAGPRRRVKTSVAPGEDGFAPGQLCEHPPVTEMSVTSFRAYLASPYWFYLRHVARLVEREDDAVEMGAKEFGILIHKALDRFGKSPERDSTDVGVIEKCLEGFLLDLSTARFGSRPSPAVRLQIEFARKRLKKFAAWQAVRRASGWRITEGEWRPAAGHALLDLGGKTIRLTGRIDRIDVNERTGQQAVLDYKTGEGDKEPDKEHRGRAGWKDLQLPLYRHLCAELNPGEGLVLGYIVLPRSADGVRLAEGRWNATDLADADEQARKVARAVMEGRFDDLGDRPPREGVEAWLCGVGFLGVRRRGGGS